MLLVVQGSKKARFLLHSPCGRRGTFAWKRVSTVRAVSHVFLRCLAPEPFHEANYPPPPCQPGFTQAKSLYATLAQWITLEVSVSVDRAIVTRLLSRSGRILAGISSNMGITLLVEREKGVLRGRARTEEGAKEANRVLKLKVCLACLKLPCLAFHCLALSCLVGKQS